MKNDNPGKKPFPWCCSKCRKQTVYGATVDYTRKMHHEKREYTVTINGLKTPQCTNCGQVMLDAEALAFFDDVFIRQINLLTPAQIQEYRLKAKLTQHELALALGVEDWTVEWMEKGGYLHSRTLDNLMRLFFALPQVREILTSQQISAFPPATPVT